MRKLEFWYDFASTYSYLSAMRIEAAAKPADVEIIYRPFLLGPIFKAQGWTTSPFNLFPTKGRYMVRDIARVASGRGVPFQMPQAFPANGLHAARVALAGEAEGWIAPFTRAVFAAEFAEQRDIADAAVLTSVLDRLGVDTQAALARSTSPEIKDRLRTQTEAASVRGIFGAPTFITEDGELFWGDDRLDQAIGWTLHRAT
ncbi:MAG: 2-hydroxychromene-2-carboxylate isomerase [Hyphomicrobiaceae bacterium]